MGVVGFRVLGLGFMVLLRRGLQAFNHVSLYFHRKYLWLQGGVPRRILPGRSTLMNPNA